MATPAMFRRALVVVDGVAHEGDHDEASGLVRLAYCPFCAASLDPPRVRVHQ